jgi:dienelactone hydrolase
MPRLRFLLALVLATVLVLADAMPTLAQNGPPDRVTTEDVFFDSGDLTLAGTVLIPDGDGPWPAVALVHGASLGLRDENLGVAGAFARDGVLTLIYDKRTEGYAASGVGGRDYSLLADDALAAVTYLQGRSDVRPDMVGLWGLSEGAWVVPMAAARSDDVAFLVLAGAAAIPPAQQESWRHEHLLRHAGVSGSLLETIPRDLVHLLVTTDLMSEADYDPVPVLTQIEQPVLAVWGEMERTGPPTESAQIMSAVLEQAGNTHASMAFIPGATHELKVATDDGFRSEDAYSPAYLDLITGWVNDVAAGNPPPSSVGDYPHQEFLSWPGAADPPAILAGGWLQLIAGLVLLLAFPLFGLLGLLGRGVLAPVTMRAPARWLAITAWLAVVGMFAFLVTYLLNNPPPLGPVILGRPLPWLVVQVLAFAALVAAVALIVNWVRDQPPLTGLERIRYQLLLTGTIVFIPWALYWGLLVP